MANVGKPDENFSDDSPEARLLLEVEQPTEPTEKEIKAVQEMAAFLRRQRASLNKKGTYFPDDVLNAALVKKLWSSMGRLLGTTILRHHRACGLETRHPRSRICSICGYSDNLYLQELERLMKRLVRKTAEEEAKDIAKAEAKALAAAGEEQDDSASEPPTPPAASSKKKS